MDEQTTYGNGKIKFYNGDWFKSFQRIPEKSVDLVLTDPPYNALQETQSWDRAVDLARLEMTFNEVLRPNGQVIFFADLHLLLRVLNEFTRFKLRTYHVWKKTGASMPINTYNPLPDSEFILVMRRVESKVSKLSFNPWDGLPRDRAYLKKNYQTQGPTRRMIKSAFSINDGRRWVTRTLNGPGKSAMPKSERTSHPCQKPVILCRQLIKTYSNPGGTVLDPFAGSGSSLLAAWREGRQAVGFEISPEYYDEAISRIQMATCQTNLFNDFEHSQEVAA